jgi:antitoxin ParD1/3/4
MEQTMPVQKNTSVTLGEHFEKFLAHQIESGRYGSASEAVRAGLRLLEEREAKLEALRRALSEGEQSGPADYSLQNILDELESED